MKPLTTPLWPFCMASKPVLGDLGRVRLLFIPADRRVLHLGALEEFGVGRARHQAGDGDGGVLQLVAKRHAEAVEKSLGAVVDRLEAAWNEASDRAGDQDSALVTLPHVPADTVNERDRSGDIECLPHLRARARSWSRNASPQTDAGVGQESVNRPSADRRHERIDALRSGEVRLDRLDLGTFAACNRSAACVDLAARPRRSADRTRPRRSNAPARSPIPVEAPVTTARPTRTCSASSCRGFRTTFVHSF